MARQAFLRPVVIDATNDTVNVTAGGIGPNPVTLEHGTWANWAVVLFQLYSDLVTTFSATAKVGFLSDGRVAFADTGANLITLTWATPQLGYSLGFTAAAGPAQVITSTYPVDHAWFPTYQHADQVRFALMQADAFDGSKSKDGSLSGSSTGPDVFHRRFTFEHVAAELAYREGAIIVAAAQEWHPERCFETLIKQARTSYPTQRGWPSCKGFYYVPDFPGNGHLCFATDTPLTDAQPALENDWGGGGILFDLTATPDWYVFGFPGVAGWTAAPVADVPRARQWYECGFEMTTAPAQAWYTPRGGEE